jgi:hypothetical protein
VDPFYDMLFNMLIAFVFCFIVALLAMNPRATKAGDVPAKAEFIITLSWPDNDPNDLDAWVQGPGGDVVWFRQREAGPAAPGPRRPRPLQRHRWWSTAAASVNPVNQEVVTLRGIAPGEYVVKCTTTTRQRTERPEPGAAVRCGHRLGGQG